MNSLLKLLFALFIIQEFNGSINKWTSIKIPLIQVPKK